MGNKISPTGLRMGVNKTWRSRWFAKGDEYVKQLHEDLEVRDFINENLKSAGVAEVVIKRSANKVFVDVKVARPGVVIGRAGAGIEKLKKDLDKLMGTNVELTVSEVKKPDLSSKIVAARIAQAIEHRVVPKIAVLKEIENIKAAGAKGVKIWVSGCIRGASIARTDKFEWGTVPLHTIRADIDFAREKALTVSNGVHGIKVWICKGEKLDTEVEEIK